MAVVAYDEYGFAVFGSDRFVDSERCHNNYSNKTFSETEIEAWEKLLLNWEDSKTRLSKLQTYIRRGVPRQFRAQFWKLLLDVQALRVSNSFNYEDQLALVRDQLVDLGVSEYGSPEGINYLSDLESTQYRIKYGDISMDALRHIFLDLDRSFPTHRMFMGDSAEAQEGRASLFRILAIYARYNSAVEYCQGMSTLAGVLLMTMDEEDAFWCLVSLLERGKYLLGYFDDHMERVQKHAEVFKRLLGMKHADLQQHLSKLEVDPLMFLTPWFMCLFTSLPCWDTVLAIWDLLLLEGNQAAFRVSLTIIEVLKTNLLNTKDLCILLPSLLHPDPDMIKYDVLIPAIWNTHLEDWEVSSILAIMEEEKKRPLLGKRRRNTSSSVRTDEHCVVEFKGQSDRRKRAKKEPENQNPSILRRFARIFQSKPVDGSVVPSGGVKPLLRTRFQTKHNASPNIQIVRDDSATNLGSLSVPSPATGVSPCREASERSFVVPRCRPLRDITPKTNKPRTPRSHLDKRINIGDSRLPNGFRLATVQHAFKEFHTPTPLRKTQRPLVQSPLEFIASPEVELRPLTKLRRTPR